MEDEILKTIPPTIASKIIKFLRKMFTKYVPYPNTEELSKWKDLSNTGRKTSNYCDVNYPMISNSVKFCKNSGGFIYLS